ncbi:MAG: adenine glycosylase [Coriobacteriales bacterium]|jgi:A/G-specific adenine glycosylase|nr:adenine glycosylase [Coriobacteriales bacterium]
MECDAFISLVKAEGERLYRTLPWRETRDPYEVLLSEIMLQQTQVVRVLKHWEPWLLKFPTLDALAAASLPDVLAQWQGLGYNRRAVALKRAVEHCASVLGGSVPHGYEALLALPGVGPATAAGVCVFAYGEPQVYLETNVRTVFIHHFFAGQDGVADSEIRSLVEQTCDEKDPRSWYYALLDYGNYLKRTLPNPSRRSKHHAQQSAYIGSVRQKRAFLLRMLLATPDGATSTELLQSLNAQEHDAGRSHVEEDALAAILSALALEGFVTHGESTPELWMIAGQESTDCMLPAPQ